MSDATGSAAAGHLDAGADEQVAPPPLSGFLGKLDQDGYATLIARLSLGGVFIHHGLAKIAEPVIFLKFLKGYGLLPLEPPAILNSIAVILPWIEVVVGVLLVLGLARRPAALIAFAMLAVFTPAVVHLALEYQAKHPEIAFHRIVLDCGCGAGPVNVIEKLAENVGLSILALWLLVSRSRRFIIGPFL